MTPEERAEYILDALRLDLDSQRRETTIRYIAAEIQSAIDGALTRPTTNEL